MHNWASIVISVVAAIAVIWLILFATLAVSRPDGGALREASRVLPDLLRLISRLARDRSLPRRVRWRLWLLLGYLASPIDIIPDFIPVIGYADDVVVTALLLRSTVRAAGLPAVRAHWPGTPDGFDVLQRLIRMTPRDEPAS